VSARSPAVALAVARRSTRKLFKSPVLAITPTMIPLLFFAAFTGALSSFGDAPGFDYYDYTAFNFVFVLYQAAIYMAIFTSFELASDFQTGVARRMMSAAPHRMAIVAGYVISALGRGVVVVAVVWAVALISGMPVRGNAIEIAGLVVLALLLNVATSLYGAGVVLRLKSTAAGALILIPAFMVMFLSPVFTVRDQLGDWLETVAGVNPLTALLEAGRGFLAGDPVSVAVAFAAGLGFVIVFGVWAVLGMRRAERTA
jgi:ABC-2 type transport system permease protein